MTKGGGGPFGPPRVLRAAEMALASRAPSLLLPFLRLVSEPSVTGPPAGRRCANRACGAPGVPVWQRQRLLPAALAQKGLWVGGSLREQLEARSSPKNLERAFSL